MGPAEQPLARALPAPGAEARRSAGGHAARPRWRESGLLRDDEEEQGEAEEGSCSCMSSSRIHSARLRLLSRRPTASCCCLCFPDGVRFCDCPDDTLKKEGLLEAQKLAPTPMSAVASTDGR